MKEASVIIAKTKLLSMVEGAYQEGFFDGVGLPKEESGAVAKYSAFSEKIKGAESYCGKEANGLAKAIEDAFEYLESKRLSTTEKQLNNHGNSSKN